jgi:hypothetical protein
MKNASKSMKRGNGVKTAAKKVRTTISLPADLYQAALLRAKELRRGSFSNHVENLIAADVPQGVLA